MASVMISFSADGLSDATALADRLRAAAIDAWLYTDRLTVGDDVPERCLAAAVQCDVFLAVATPRWARSTACRDEISAALMERWSGAAIPHIIVWTRELEPPPTLRAFVRPGIDATAMAQEISELVAGDTVAAQEVAEPTPPPAAIAKARTLLTASRGWRSRYHDEAHGSVAASQSTALRSVERRLDDLDFLELSAPPRPTADHRHEVMTQTCLLYGAVLRWHTLSGDQGEIT